MKGTFFYAFANFQLNRTGLRFNFNDECFISGVMFAPRSFSEDGIETHWAVNHLGHYLLTRLLSNNLAGGRVLYMVNLDYRFAKEGINFKDINMKESYNRKYAFYQSQLANVLMIQSLAKELNKDFITVNGVYPGVCKDTNIKRHMGVDKSKILSLFSRPFLYMLEKNPSEGAATPLFMLLDNTVGEITGKIFTNMAEMAITDIADDQDSAQKLLDIDDYWTGLKTKEELIKIHAEKKVHINKNDPPA